MGIKSRAKGKLRRIKNRLKRIKDTLTGDVINLGIIGTGRIAERFVRECRDVSHMNISAVYNIRKDSAERFASVNQLKNPYDDIEAFFAAVDAVYIASPHETHYPYAKLALEHGKHVLCEKPMCLNSAEAEELIKYADDRGLVIVEALKTAFLDGFRAMTNAAIGGAIGEVHDIEAAFTKLESENGRELTDIRYGGSFLELGSYSLLPIFRVFGCGYKDVTFQSVYAENGLDTYTKAIFDFGKGKFATAKCGLKVKSEGNIVISGESGYIIKESPWWLTDSYTVRYEDPNRIERREFKLMDGGLCHEAGFFVEYIRKIKDSDTSLLDERKRLSEESIARAKVMETFLDRNSQKRAEAYKKEKGSRARIWAHRGMSMAYPENTLTAFKKAAELGQALTGIETDIQLTKDKEIVVIHDEAVDRVTDAKGYVRDYTLSEIKSFNIRSVNGENEKIPTLDELLTLLKPYMEKNGLLLNIELKTSVYRYEGIEELALETVKKHGVQDYIIWSSFLKESVKHIRELCPGAKTGMLASKLSDCIEGAEYAGADALHPYCYALDTDVPEKYKGKVRTWGGQEPLFSQGQGARLIEKNMQRFAKYGVSDIITNVPDRYIENGTGESGR